MEEQNLNVMDGNKCAVIWVPENTVAFSVKVKYFKEDLSIGEAECDYGPIMAHEAFKDGELWEEENARYVINYDKTERIGDDVNDD